MKIIKTPVKGMCEHLPQDMEIREFVLAKFKAIYKKFGFQTIETPVVEHLENLCSKNGGENEKLIFKILKRGEKLNINDAELADCALRYDLTVPLARFYANNITSLQTPFKCLQVGSVFRADRPQKGRYRQFTQFDLDILGDASNFAEIELISATAQALSSVIDQNITVKVNDRKLLKQMALAAGFEEDKVGSVFIELDKLDKIGFEGVQNSLVGLGFECEVVEKYLSYFKDCKNVEVKNFLEKNNIEPNEEICNNLQAIISTTNAMVSKNVSVVFDPTLVRGMDYYTGTIFEAGVDSLNMSFAGGGRYDGMVSNFSGTNTPACGFSVGFERIVLVLKEQGFKVENNQCKIAYLVDKECGEEKTKQVFEKASLLRNDNIVLVVKRQKNAKFQKENLQNAGYETIIDVFENTQI